MSDELRIPKDRATHIDRDPMPSLDASKTDPDVNAFTVAEYVFCPRAGILAHEGGHTDLEPEFPPLGLLDWYKEDAIEDAYARSVYRLFWWLVGFVAGLVILSLVLLGHFLYPILMLALVGGCAYFTAIEYQRWRVLSVKRLEARFAQECDPDPNSKAFQPVDWWGLLKAGFEVRRPKTALRDDDWKLGGKPRRILQKGSMAIPVYRAKKDEQEAVSPQHIVRGMVYCHLIEAREGAVSPFAIVLFGDTYKGTTVPNVRAHRERSYDALERVRKMIVDSKAGERQPPEPVRSSICRDCHYGRPRRVALMEKTMQYDKPLDPRMFENRKGQLFHCDCGDRFGGKPKHRLNAKLRRLG